MLLRKYEMPWRRAYEAYAGLAWAFAFVFFILRHGALRRAVAAYRRTRASLRDAGVSSQRTGAGRIDGPGIALWQSHGVHHSQRAAQALC